MIDTTNFFYFDIETAGKYKDFETFKKSDERGAALFSYKVKRKQKSNPNDEQWKGTDSECYLKNASLLAEFGQIVCISYAYYGTGKQLMIGSIIGPDEESIIKEAHKVFSQVAKINRKICGYNIKSFDIPWVFKKMLSYNIMPPSNIMTFDKKPWDITCLDLMEVWKSTGFEAATFDEMTYALNVKSPKSEMDGTMVHSYYHTGRIDEIKRYCESDVRALVDAATVLQDLAV